MYTLIIVQCLSIKEGVVLEKNTNFGGKISFHHVLTR